MSMSEPLPPSAMYGRKVSPDFPGNAAPHAALNSVVCVGSLLGFMHWLSTMITAAAPSDSA